MVPPRGFTTPVWAPSMTIPLVTGVNPLQTTWLERGIVSGRVTLLLRSAEIQPLFVRFVQMDSIHHPPHSHLLVRVHARGSIQRDNHHLRPKAAEGGHELRGGDAVGGALPLPSPSCRHHLGARHPGGNNAEFTNNNTQFPWSPSGNRGRHAAPVRKTFFQGQQLTGQTKATSDKATAYPPMHLSPGCELMSRKSTWHARNQKNLLLRSLTGK